MGQRFFCLLLVISFGLAVVGCATIMSGRMQQLPVTSNPTGATVTVGSTKQTTPATFNLDRKAAVYEVVVEKEGYEPVTIVLKKGMNGWVWGNILLGGIIGLIIDTSTGSAAKFVPSEIEVNLIKKQLGFNDLNGKDILFVKLKEEAR